MADKREILSLSEAMEGLPKDFGFFAERFTSSIQPSLAGRETDRVKAVKKQRNFLVIGVVLAIAGTAIGFGVFQEPFGLFLGALAGFGMYAWGSADITKLGKETKLIVTGKPDESSLIKSIGLPEDDENAMPPKDKGTRVTKEQAELLKKWIEAGAAWPDDAKLTVPAK